ncbi:hypothetical protein HWV23_02805 [Natronomonas halophila]|uniref:hypothetical protein n=1 Tax=Natronomonas halophila TaxID=2747817 RepID=UPI0015B49584|nr:hypothetical protein [Natronomonas halophila]QLD84632.1 hypothetical protein HWV23_02530 [Natronomonas halophila]QLD84686.1 hypothetical protein HWV23_02805 [Natronomonas halophila]
MNPIQTHLESEGADLSVDDALEVRIRQHVPGDSVIREFERRYYKAVLDACFETAQKTTDIPEPEGDS